MDALDLLEPVAIEQVCRTCSRITDLGNVAHHKVGLRNCDLIPTHRFVHGDHSCTKWTPRIVEQALEVV